MLTKAEEERIVSHELMNLRISLRNGENGLQDTDIGHRLSHKVSTVALQNPSARCAWVL